MKHILFIVTLALGLWSCDRPEEKAVTHSVVHEPVDNTVKLHQLKKLFVVGDFDGDKKQDTVFQHTYSGLTKAEIENSADPFQNEWDTVVKWFYDQQADVYLKSYTNSQDTLHLGTAQGLYCLLNIGDNNTDGKDEMALVVDYLDMSRVNSCNIYTLCKGKWTLLKQFGVHEDAFNFSSDKAPVFYDIKDFLEKQNGKWVYMDYSQDGYDNPEEVGKMSVLKPGKCK